MDFSLLPAVLPILYIAIHTLLHFLCPRVRPYVLGLNGLLLTAFVLLILRVSALESSPEGLTRFLLFWGPLIFTWWAYLWSRHTFSSIHPAGFFYDDVILDFEERWFNQPSLRWSRRSGRFVSEILHFCYTSYYFYTFFLGIYLDFSGRITEFQRMTFAVILGYLISYTLFAFTPVLGPRWSLVDRGLISEAEQRQKGYLFTRLTNKIMYGGPAHKGGAMPSSHSSTAVIFAVWCWWLWGWPGGVPATLIVLGMWLGSIYGRYHFVLDVLLGALIGVFSLVVASLLI